MPAPRLLLRFTLPWLFIVIGALAHPFAYGDAVQLMLANPGIQSPYINEYLHELLSEKEIDPGLVQSVNWQWNTRQELDNLAREFQAFIPVQIAEPLALRLDIREYNHAKHGRGLFLIGVVHTVGHGPRPLALIARSFRKSLKDGAVEVWGDSLRIDHSAAVMKNMIFPILSFLDTIYVRTGVARERLVADWRGRFYWTEKDDYDFDPDYRFQVNGQKLDQLTVVRANFLRFLAFHKIKLTELVHGNGKRAKSIEEFKSPQDFTRAKHPRRKLKVPTYTDVDTRERLSKPLNVGVAFALADYTIRCPDLLAYNELAMPPWRAIRVITAH